MSCEIAGRFSEAALPMHVTHSVFLSIASHPHPSQSSELEQEGCGVWGRGCPSEDSDSRHHGKRIEDDAPNGRQSPFEKNTKSYQNGLKRRQALLARSKMVREGRSSRERGRGRDIALESEGEVALSRERVELKRARERARYSS